MSRKILFGSFLSLIILSNFGCKKSYLDTKPSDAILPDAAYASVAALNSSLTATYLTTYDYAPLSGGGAMHDAFGQKGIDLANDLMGNDMVVHSQGFGWFNADYQYVGWTLPDGVNRRSDITWTYYYKVIKEVNLLIDNIPTENSSAEQIRVKGEALGLRAWAYFGLANNFQQTYVGNENAKGVPLYTSLDLAGINPSRGILADVYKQIIKDLNEAETFLAGAANRERKDRVDVSVVRGLRARVALVMEDWDLAADYAKKARTAEGYALMEPAKYTSRSAFSSMNNNTEWMWGSFIPSEQATIFASFFSHMDVDQRGYATFGGQKKITKDLYDRMSDNDIRKKLFTAPSAANSSFPAYNQLKFRVPVVGSWAADYLYMRTSEMYLIEAEALAKKGNDAGAIAVLEELIKKRYPQYTAAGLSGTALVNEILLQRRIELWGEGFSLFDIKRTGMGLNRLTGEGNHGAPSLNPRVLTLPPASPNFLMRIPQRELDNNPSMTPLDQNP